MKSLDEILTGKEPPKAVEQPKEEAPAPEVQEAPVEAEAKPERPRDEKGKFVAKGEAEAKPEAPKVEKPAAPTAAEKPKETKQDTEQQPPQGFVPLKAVQEERGKRQELERRLQELEARQRQPQPKLDPVSDPDGYAQRVLSQAEELALGRILNFSEAGARRVYGDELVTEVQQAFLEEANSNPLLWQQLHSQADPYDWAVKRHKREKFMREVQDPDEWTKQQREAIRRELEAEYAQRVPQAPARPAPAAPPPSLANATATGGGIQTAPVFRGPTPLETILRRK